MSNKYEVLFLVESGIGNILESLYAVEYCLKNSIKTGIYLNKTKPSFVDYLRKCYGPEVILESPENISTKHLVHSFTFQETWKIDHQHYFYVQPDFNSTKLLSETEQYLSIVKTLFPSTYESKTLSYLKEDYSERVQNLHPEKKLILYPGGASSAPSKRWPHYQDLINKWGEDRVIVLGNSDDLNFECSYCYPPWITGLAPQKVLNSKSFFNLLKSLGLLIPHAHGKEIQEKSYAFFDCFSWEELTALLRRGKFFIGNDGGLMHLAAACGAQGLALFGATSINKNRPLNSKIKPVAINLPCQPCQFGVGGIHMTRNYVNCPFQIKCLRELSPESVLAQIPMSPEKS